MKSAISILWLILSLINSPALARSCTQSTYAVEEARSKLKRAAEETELESAKDEARRAKNALEDAAYAARQCDCNRAFYEFDDAATKAKRARDADTADEFVSELNRSIRSFNSALDSMRRCR